MRIRVAFVRLAAAALAACTLAAPAARGCRVLQISAGDDYSMALREDGTPWTWGGWQPDILSRSSTSVVPVQKPGLSDVAAVSHGDTVAWVVRSDRTVWKWFV